MNIKAFSNRTKIKIIIQHIIFGAILFLASFIKIPLAIAAQDQWEAITPVGAAGTFTSIVSVNDYVYLSTTQGIYKSSNGGSSWSTNTSGLTNTNVKAIAIGWTYDMENGIYVADTDTPVFAATADGIFKSTLGSSTWTAASTGLTNTNTSDIVFDQFKTVLSADNSTLYAGGAGGVYRSDDSGDTWTAVNTGIEGKSVKKIMTEFNGDFSAGNVFAITSENEIYDSITFSTDGATPESWSLLEDEDLDDVTLNDVSFLYPTGGVEFLSTEENGILKSNNSGASWSAKNTGLSGLNIKSVQSDYTISNIVYAAGHSLGIFKSINEGESWASANLGLGGATIIDVNTNPTSSSIAYAISSSAAYLLDLSDPLIIPSVSDATAPSQITTISASDNKAYAFTLNWVAPGDDDDSGTATSYDLRYSTATITEENWDSATQVSGEPEPEVAGTPQSMVISDLTPGTTYYFAIKTSDEVPNESMLSSVISALITYAGDLNDDHTVDLSDFSILRVNYDTDHIAADINKDGIVDLFDYGIFRKDYGEIF